VEEATASGTAGSGFATTVVANPDPEPTQNHEQQVDDMLGEEPEQLSTFQRLQAALDGLSPLLQRANAALTTSSLRPSDLSMV
jgi:hypothetical protein